MAKTGTPLTRYILEEQKHHPGATGEFTALLAQISLAAKHIARQMSQAGLINILGTTGEINVQGEAVKKMDRFANDAFQRAFQYGAQVSVLVTEELAEPVSFPENQPAGKYVLFIDPLDGSSNIDVNAPVGSIFSIHRLADGTATPSRADLLKKGVEQIAAGYVVYGPSTMLVYSCGQGVHGFTLDAGIGEFLLSHESITIPARGTVYSVNEGNYRKWPAHTQRVIDYLREVAPEDGRPYSGRYIGALVADFHRTLLTGGIYLYPGETKKPEGKIRLMYESAPLAFVVEHAGGTASTGTDRILDIQPTSIHQRTPIFIGSKEDVALAEAFVSEGKEGGQ